MKARSFFRLSKNTVPLIGIGGWVALYLNKLSLESRMEDEIVQRVFDELRNDPEIMETFGYDFRPRTALLAAARSRISFDGLFGEGSLTLNTPKGKFFVDFNGSSQTYDSIVKSDQPRLNKSKYNIPDQKVINAIKKELASEDGEKRLRQTSLKPETRFWSLDFINVSASSSSAVKNKSFIRKPSTLVNLEQEKPTLENLWGVYNSTKAS